jgi:hypothetical protein
MAMNDPASIVDLATYREAAAHPCAYCGRPTPANDRLPRVTYAVGIPILIEPVKHFDLPPTQVHTACAMRAELGRGFGFAP